MLDVDGVLTDGRIAFSHTGERTQTFHVHDGRALKQWQALGGQVVLVSGREGGALDRRAWELGIKVQRTGIVDKLEAYTSLKVEMGFRDVAIAYVGDDEPDLPPMSQAAFPVAVANAMPRVKRAARYVTRRSGGEGAVAEVIDMLLRARSISAPPAPST